MFPLAKSSNRMFFPLFFPLRAETRESFLFPVDHLIQQSGGAALCFPRRVGVDVHRGTDVRVLQQFLHVLWRGPVGQEVARKGVPLCGIIRTNRMSTPVRFCSFSPNRECRKMAGKGVQPLNNYTCRFCPSSLKCTDKSGLDGLQAGK